jgi:hypothetical protein
MRTQVIKVRRQVERVNGGGVDIRPPKHGSDVTWTPTITCWPSRVVISAHFVASATCTPGCSRVSTGTPLRQNSVEHQWRKCRTKAAQTFTDEADRTQVAQLRLHDLRHFYDKAEGRPKQPHRQRRNVG